MTRSDSMRVSTPGIESTSTRSRASDFATLGTANSPMAAGAMLLMYNLAIALFVGLGPLFILCLISEQTKALFSKWLMYGIGTLFSIAILYVVTSIVLNLTVNLAGALWSANLINSVTGQGSEGYSSQAIRQGGMGLLMTVLIISVPPMAAMFFNGTMGSFMPYAALGGGAAAARPGPQGQPPGSYGGGYYAAPSNSSPINLAADANNAAASSPVRLPGNTSATQPEAIKTFNPQSPREL